MKLGLWIDQKGWSRQKFADEASVHPVTVSKWVTGRMTPRPQQMMRIEEITGGEVAPQDFYPKGNISAPEAA